MDKDNSVDEEEVVNEDNNKESEAEKAAKGRLFKGFNFGFLTAAKKKKEANAEQAEQIFESLTDEELNALKLLRTPEKLTAEQQAQLRELKAKEAKIRRNNDATRTFFRMIDLLFDNAQNSNPYITRAQVKSIQVDTDIAYADEEICKLDMYRVPKENDTEKYPVMLEIHGGGFVAGDKNYRRAISQVFALEGLFVFTVNYGLSPDVKYPEPVKHIFAALDYIADHADELNLDLSRIIISGDSAGAYYAALVAAGCNNKEYLDFLGVNPKARPTAAILDCGIYDIETAFNANIIFDMEDKVFSCFIGKDKAEFDNYEYKDVCAPNQIIKDCFPPSFIIYSPNDMFCKGQSESLIKLLDEKGCYYESFCAEQKASNHCFPLTWRGYDAVRSNALMLSFIQRYLRGAIKY